MICKTDLLEFGTHLAFYFALHFWNYDLIFSPKVRIKSSFLLAHLVLAPALKFWLYMCRVQPWIRTGFVHPCIFLVCGACFISWIPSCPKGLFFVAGKLLTGSRAGWLWHGMVPWKLLRISCEMLQYFEFSCCLFCLFFNVTFSMGNVYGICYQQNVCSLNCSAGVLFLSGWLQLLAQVYDLILHEIDLIGTIDSFHDQYVMS